MVDASYTTCTDPDPSTFSSKFDVPSQYNGSRVAAQLAAMASLLCAVINHAEVYERIDA